MLVIRVELWSAVTGERTEIARAHICNVGGDSIHGNYEATTFRGRSAAHLAKRIVQRQGKVTAHPRLKLHVWHLVAKALKSMGYGNA